MNNNYLKSFGYELSNRLFIGDTQSKYREIIDGDLQCITKKYLSQLLAFVSRYNAYYKHLNCTLSTLSTYPVLTKKLIRENYQSIFSNISLKGVFRNSSGGSTGEPITLLQDQNYNCWNRATEKYYFHTMLNVDYNQVSKVVLWGSDRDALRQFDWKGRAYNWLSNTIFLNTFNADEKTWLDYAKIINQNKPYFIKGYAGSLYQIAKICKNNNYKIYTPMFIYSSAETLRDFMRSEIETVFNTKVYDFYGSREVGAIAGECKFGYKHIFTFNNFIETIHIRNTNINKIIITNLHNLTMPLIRYEIGDVGTISNKLCSCKNQLPYFTKLDGRITDYFIKTDGTLVHGEFFTHLFYFQDWIKQFQVIQTNKLAITINCVLIRKKSQEAINIINTKIKTMMGNDCKITWNFQNNIYNLSTGKYLFTKSLVSF